MAERAVIIVVDDESDVLGAMLDSLTRRFGRGLSSGALSVAVFCVSGRLQEQGRK